MVNKRVVPALAETYRATHERRCRRTPHTREPAQMGLGLDRRLAGIRGGVSAGRGRNTYLRRGVLVATAIRRLARLLGAADHPTGAVPVRCIRRLGREVVERI